MRSLAARPAVLLLVLAFLGAVADQADAKKKKKSKKKGKKETPAVVLDLPRSKEPLPELTAPEAPEGAITFAAVGDVMMGSTFPEERLPPEDGAKMLEAVTPIL